MKFLFVMDPITTVRPYKDTSYFLMLAAYQLGHEVFQAEISDLYFQSEARCLARQYKIKAYAEGDTYQDVFLDESSIDLAIDLAIDSCDVVWIRKDPPFDDSYLYMTRLLSLSKKPIIINSPMSLQAWNEKLAALEFKDWTPWTLVSSKGQQITSAIQKKGGRFVLKPLDGFGGKGIEFIDSSAPDLAQFIDEYLKTHGPVAIIQEYLKEASAGDKRILLWKGEPIGAVLRLHAEGKELNNIDAGGKALASEITPKELELCQQMKPLFLKMGLYFVGIDMIGERLTEINITSPTTLQEMSRLNQKDLHIEIIRDLESEVLKKSPL